MSKVTVSKINTCTGHRDCVYALADCPDSQYFFSSGGDGMIVKWDIENPEEGQLLAQVKTSVYSLRYIPENNFLMLGQNLEGLQIIDVENQKISASLKLDSCLIFWIETYKDVAYVAMQNGYVYLIDIFSMAILAKIHCSEQSARVIAINPVADELAVGYSDYVIRIFDLTGGSLKREMRAHSNSVFALRYSPDGKYLLSGGRDAHLKVWNVEENYELHEDIIAHMYTINDVVFSPNGKHFVTCSMDKSIKVWDYSTFTLLKVIDKSRHAGHGNSINKLIWTHFNNQLISCSDDRTISLWDLKFS
ncbi:MAG: WD40 repeat domain-containing protein [Bacteroidetes bacterium]|nr:WD40 repeat domain-containing protein [Bacteroidota bacterium]MDA1119716.1 WD40 repeat domain-containing protein [Bacteroidota bacterium]